MNSNRMKVLAGVIVLLLMTLVVVRSVIAGPQTSPGKKDIEKAARVVTPAGGVDERTEVPKGNYVAGNGIIEPADRETKVASPVAGRIAKILVMEGDIVDVGAELVKLDDDVETAALAAAEGDLASARADLLRTLHGQRKEDQQGNRAGRGEFVVQRRLQFQSARIRVHSVEGGERADDGLASGNGSRQADANSPVQPQRRNQRLDDMPDGSNDAVLDCRGGPVADRNVCRHRQRQRHQENHGPGTEYERLGSVQHP